ncbi:hypothetical protein HMPREF0063_10628 [Aeromicrobium marinum DSM 15272]|uniref:Low molecular weight protein antigen 6 PH domain-containing protein n=2 Tax=Aeromicrobium marinum TaxID=219314 RepID=E2S9I8_9ACTN|nr:hypothetical protein HMPREF0063_10628 [Aeromicrobium marinum DSM 15272]
MAALLTVRPGGARYVAYGVAAVLLVMTVVIGVSLPETIEFTTAELVTLAFTLGGVLVVLHGVGRSRVVADEAGIRIVNGYRSHDFHWAAVAGISMKEGDPWPTLLTIDDARVMLFAIQRTDGPQASAAVRRLRELAA